MFVCPDCGARQAEPGHCGFDGAVVLAIGEDVLLGTTIGAYRVARLLGIGGMGRVYKGVHPTIGSRVAIKVLSRECSDRRDLVERFFSEARAVNVIRHESIVNVLDLAVLPDGRPYIIMEYLDGASLAAIVETAHARGLPLPLGGVARLAGEVLDALAAAHAKGVVHRDLKPDNIFVAPSGRPKVLDFGIAKLTDTPHTATATGSLLGTPHYMAPEQAAGKPVDYRADLYAMGVILFECTTGQKPFEADALFDLLRKHVEAPPPPPHLLRRDLPPAFEHVILTALAKAPEQRFASAHAMSLALQQATQQLPPEAWQPLTPAIATGTTAGSPSGGHWAPTQPQSWSSTPAGPIGTPSTLSAGQVGTTKPASKKGWWIVLAAAVVVGVGIAAAVVATNGSSKDTQVAANAGGTTAAIANPGGTAIPPTPPTTTPPTTTSPTPRPPTPPTRPQPTGTWVTRHSIDAPSGYDPQHLEVGAFVAWAQAAAQREIPDAQLFRIDASGVSPDGRANVSLATLASDHGSIDVRFISLAHGRRDPKIPLGVRRDWKCEFRVEATPDGVAVSPIDGWDCTKEHPLPLPKCSFSAVWKKAIAKKAPATDAVGSLGYRSNFDGGATWYFDIGFGTDAAFSEMFPDNC